MKNAQETTKVQKTRSHMVIKDAELTAPNGEKFSLHYRALGKLKDHYSGFLRKIYANWPRNCAISIPIVYGKKEFQDVVNTVLDNAEKFNESNTVGRPRYFDILQDGVEKLKSTNLIADLKANHPEFGTKSNSCRSWWYRNIAGNFNMRSIKITSLRFKNVVAFNNLMENIKDKEIHKLVENLKHKTFEFEKEFIDFADKFIEATYETFVTAYNDYMGNLIGTVSHRPVKLKNGGWREHYTMYVPDCNFRNATLAERNHYLEVYNKCLQQLPDNLGRQGAQFYRDVTVTPCALMPTAEVATESAKIKKAEMVKKLNASIEASKKARKTKKETA